MEFDQQSKWEEIKSYVEAAILADREEEDGEISETRKKAEMIEEVGEAMKRDGTMRKEQERTRQTKRKGKAGKLEKKEGRERMSKKRSKSG